MTTPAPQRPARNIARRRGKRHTLRRKRPLAATRPRRRHRRRRRRQRRRRRRGAVRRRCCRVPPPPAHLACAGCCRRCRQEAAGRGPCMQAARAHAHVASRRVASRRLAAAHAPAQRGAPPPGHELDVAAGGEARGLLGAVEEGALARAARTCSTGLHSGSPVDGTSTCGSNDDQHRSSSRQKRARAAAAAAAARHVSGRGAHLHVAERAPVITGHRPVEALPRAALVALGARLRHPSRPRQHASSRYRSIGRAHPPPTCAAARIAGTA
eukprot:scaffold659_cov329-Prasinococcus_capsulatus_cf.AAC.32